MKREKRKSAEELRHENSQMNERRLSYEDSEKLKSENYNLRQRLQQSESDRDRLKKQLNEATTIHLPDEALLQRFTAALKGADSKARDII